jgi:hypothetical protein
MDRMHGIKLIYPDHLKYAHLSESFPESDPRQTLMNFKNTTRNRKLAESIPTGHRALVFTRQHIVWAIEFTGPIDDGTLLAAHGVDPVWPTTEWSVHRPIRFLAKMDVTADQYLRTMHRREIMERTGISKRSYGSGHFYITADEYRRMYEVIPWDWEGENALVSAALDQSEAYTKREKLTSILPPIPNAGSFLEHLRSIVGQPERNMEDAVKEFFVLLGHDRSTIRFQVGRIDLLIGDQQEQPSLVCEVKRSLVSSPTRDDALRKGFDYAARCGARYVVITDADRYEIFDRKAGLDHQSMSVGTFQLTALQHGDLSFPRLDGRGGLISYAAWCVSS